ncbi:MAG: hypothetical protein U0Q15_04120 [Kineosporiaceae bacterium]
MSVTTTVPQVQPRQRWTWRRQLPAWNGPLPFLGSPWLIASLAFNHLQLLAWSVTLVASLALFVVARTAARLATDRRSATLPPPRQDAPQPQRPDALLAASVASRLLPAALGVVLLADPSLLRPRVEPGLFERVAGVTLVAFAAVDLIRAVLLWREACRTLGAADGRPRAEGRVVGELDGEPVVDIAGVGRVVLTDGTRHVRHLMQDDVVVIDGVLNRRSLVAVTAARGVGWARVRRILAAEVG